MTSSMKTPGPAGPAKSGASTRVNPVCLEVNVTLRSLPGEAGSPAQPIREDLRTVIVFDNGAVLRSANNLPAGLTLILSNTNSRDVVCRVVTGRSMPAVKGYVEIEFIEPVKDFWGIHQEIAPAQPASTQMAPTTPHHAPPTTPTPLAAAPPSSPAPPIQHAPAPPAAPRVAPSPQQPPAVSRPRVPQDLPTASSLATPLEFDEFPGPMNVSSANAARESKPDLPASPSTFGINSRVAAEKSAPDAYSHQATSSTPVATWQAPSAEPAVKSVPPTSEEMSGADATPAGRDFMSKGLMAYEQPAEPAAPSVGRTPMIVGVAALALAAIVGVALSWRRGNSVPPVAKAAPVSEVTTAQRAAIDNPPAMVRPARQADVAEPTQTESRPQAQTIAAAQPVQPEAAVAPIPAAAIASASPSDARTDSSSARKQDKSQSTAKQPDTAPSKRPMLSNLKMGAPSTPRKNGADGGDSPAPMAMAANEIPDGATPASLLTAAGRTSGMPAPPAEAPPPPVKPPAEPRLISSTRPIYPQTAKQANIEGSVTLMIYINETGKVFSARALNGPVMLRAAAEDAVKQWKYSPAQEDGKPVQSHVIVKVDFKLN